MECSMTATLQHATVIDPQPTQNKWGKTVYNLDQTHNSFTIKADDGYIFSKDGTLSYEKDAFDTPGTLTVPASNTDTVTFTIPSSIDWSIQDFFDLNMEATPAPTQPTQPTQPTTPTQPTQPITPTQPTQPTSKQYELTVNLQNAKIIDPQPTVDSSGKTHYYLDQQHTTFTIKANDGYKFDTDGSLSYANDAMNDHTTMPVKANKTDTITVSLPSDLVWENQDYFVITMGATKVETVTKTGGFTNIYKADYDSMLKISNEVMVKVKGADYQVYDASPYINNLIILPFNVPSGQKASVVVGNVTLPTQLPTVDNNYLNIDLGKITVPEQYHNAYDYYQVKTRLILPYTNMIEIDPIHVIDKTVSINYVVNVINGDTTINLANDDDLFFSQQVNLASEVPFILANNASQYTVINQLKTMFRNAIQQAYIIIEQPEPVLNSEYYPTDEKGTLQGYTGNVKASLLNNVDIDNSDLNALQNLLETGVKIK